MDRLAKFYADNNQFMGTVLVEQNGRVLLDKAYGFANLEWKIANTPDTKFRLGSITKQFTAAAIPILEERGRLSIDDPGEEAHARRPGSLGQDHDKDIC